MDAITMLRDDHKAVKRLFRAFERLDDDDTRGRRKLVDDMIRELSVHAYIEEKVFYPAVRAADSDAEDMVLEALEEHHIVKWTLSELDGMDPSEERFDPKVKVLMESVRHHVKEEQEEMFPKVSKKLDRKQLEMLGKALATAKKVVPTKPHPKAPDAPPGNLVAGAGAALLDRAKKAVGVAVAKGKKRLAKTRLNGTGATRAKKTSESRAAAH